MRRALVLLLAALPLAAGTVDVSTATSVFLHDGYSLTFGVADWNFAVNAARLGLPQDPTQVRFALVSAPLGAAGQFTGVLDSSDGSLSVPFSTPVGFISGSFQGAGYQGAVSVAQGSMSLSPAQSRQLFAGTGAFLTLYYSGPDITIGLAPYTLQQDMSVSLSGSGLSVGALPGGVILDPPENPGSPVPEPVSGLLLAAAGVLSSLSWMVRQRTAPSRKRD